MLEFVWPVMFVLLPLPWLARRLIAPFKQAESALWVPDVESFTFSSSPLSRQTKRIDVRLILLWLAWIALIAAAARPQQTGDPVNLPTSGRDLMMAVDISGSMNTEDMVLDGRRVNRLSVVKSVVNDFIARRGGDRVGLVLFGTNAYLQAPLTFDLTTVEQLLAEAPVGIAGGKTAIGDAIGLAIKRLRSRPHQSRVLILLTDGANNVGEVAPRKAAELAAVEDIRIHTVGVGSDELKVPSLFGNFAPRVVNPSADLDEGTLESVAQQTGGQYFRARNTAELEAIYALIDELEPVAQEAETFRPVKALYYWPLAFSFAFALLMLLPQPPDSQDV
jgi:Ca-activated chloride channel family protein